MKPENRKLWEACTFKRTARLESLLAQEQVEFEEPEYADYPKRHPELPNFHDIQEMWEQYRNGCLEVGFTPAVTDFAHWILGDGPYKDAGKCSVN